MAPVIFIGDDFTGASDTLATFAQAGWRTRLFLDAPTPQDCTGLDAIGIATALRALTPDQATHEIDRLWPAIAALTPDTLHLKVCSTFDSSPAVGSIGAVAQQIAGHFRPQHLAVIGGQPSLGRYCVFGNLFARAADGDVYRIDRHPVMAHHPVTPMTEADLRRVLAKQGLPDLALIPPGGAPDFPLRALFDLWQPDHLLGVAATLDGLTGRKLLIGASSVAQILTQNASLTSAPPPGATPPNTQVLAFAGSRSAVTQAQVRAATGYNRLRLAPADLHIQDGIIAKATQSLNQHKPTLIYTDPQADYGIPPDQLATTCADLLATILSHVPVGWLGIAGGDTSSRICHALGFTAIDHHQTITPGVALCTGLHTNPDRNGMRLMLKGGQMGEPDLFTRFLHLSTAATG